MVIESLIILRRDFTVERMIQLNCFDRVRFHFLISFSGSGVDG